MINEHSFGRTLQSSRAWLTCALSAIVATSAFVAMGADAVRISVASAVASADDGNVAANAIDGSLSTRWSASGDGQWIRFDLGASANIGSINIAWYQGNQRSSRFDVQTSADATSWTSVFSGSSSGTTTALESYALTASSGRYVRIVGHGNSVNLWNSIAEVELYAGQGSLIQSVPSKQKLSITPTRLLSITTMNLLYNGTTGSVCQVQASSNLVSWVNVGSPITNLLGNLTWQENVSQLPVSSWPVRFYRVKETLSSTTTTVTNPPPVTTGLPASVLNLTNWKLTLPVDTSHAGSPDEIKQPELATFVDANYFHLNSTSNGVVFKAHCGGYTTSGSGYPRSELREMTSGGSANASWSTTSGTHTMEIRQAITHLPDVKPHVVAGQIHNAADDVIVFRLEGSKLFVDQNGVNGPVLTTNYKLGDIFTVKFVVRNGGVECYYNGQYIYTYPVSTSGCYFKAGCYTQSNTSKGDAPTAYGEVVVYNVTVTHQ